MTDAEGSQDAMSDQPLTDEQLKDRVIEQALAGDFIKARHTIERMVDLRSIKAVMGMDILRAKSPSMIDKEIGVHLLAYNLVRGIMARAATGTQVLARALSFKGALQLLLTFQQHLRWAAGKSVDIMCAHLLGAISALTLPIRPGRIEPHAIKRRPKNHALLTVPRHVARASIIRAHRAYA